MLDSLGKCNLDFFHFQETNLRIWEVYIMPFYMREGPPIFFICLVINDGYVTYLTPVWPSDWPWHFPFPWLVTQGWLHPHTMLLMAYRHLKSLSLLLESPSPYIHVPHSEIPGFRSCFRSLGFWMAWMLFFDLQLSMSHFSFLGLSTSLLSQSIKSFLCSGSTIPHAQVSIY